jgi:hypothetical protein
MAIEPLEFNAVFKDKGVSDGIKDIGDQSEKTSTAITAANLRVEKSQAALTKATAKYGAESLQGRTAANNLAIANEKLAASLRKTAAAAEDSSEGVDGFKVAIGGVAALATAGLAAGVVKSMDISAGTDKLTAQLGATPAEGEKYGKAAGELYSNAYGDSLGDVNEAIRNVTQNIGQLGDTGDSSLKNVTANVLSLSQAFDVDLFESTKAVGTLIRTGLAKDANEALNLITVGFQKIPGAQEDLLDTLTEYAVQFQALGLTGPQALAFINAAMQGGARNTDLAADALKEFNLRARDLTNTGAQNALEELGLSASQTARQIAGGGPSASKALVDILTRLRAVPDAADRSRLATALLGTQAEDLQAALFAVDPAKFASGLGDISGAANDLSTTLGDNGASKVESYQRKLELLTARAGELPGPLGAAAAVTTAFGGAALGGAASVGQIAAATKDLGGVRGIVNSMSTAVTRLGITYTNTAKAARLLGPAAAVVGTAALADSLGDYIGKAQVAEQPTNDLAGALRQLGTSGKLGEAGLGLFRRSGVFGLVTDDADNTADALSRFGIEIENAFGNDLSSKIGRATDFGKSLGQVKETAGELDTAFAQLAASGSLDAAGKSYDQFIAKGRESGASLQELQALFPKYNAAVKTAGTESATAAAFSGKFADQTTATGKAAAQATLSIEDLAKVTNDYGNAALDGRQAARAYEAAVDKASESVKDNGKTLDINTEKGRTNADALDGIANAGLNLADALVKNGGTQEQFRGSLVKTRNDLIRAGQRFGLTREAARRYADSILKIPRRVNTTITSNAGTQEARLRSLASRIRGLPDGQYTVYEVLRSEDRRDAAAARRGPGAIGRRAAGGDVTAGVAYQVGERGEETFIPKVKGFILPEGRKPGDAQLEIIRGDFQRRARERRDSFIRQPLRNVRGRAAGEGTVVLQADGTRASRALVEILREAVRVGGGDVQAVLGVKR